MLWEIDRFVFVNSLMRTQALRKEILQSLKQVKAFHSLRISQLQRLVDLMHEGSFTEGEVIVKQGDEGKKFYIIVEGSCRLSKVEEGEEVEVGILNENDYFGEVALLSSEPTALTVTTITYVEVLAVRSSTAFLFLS
jgi:cAMP-dependent protein kinase regulator